MPSRTEIARDLYGVAVASGYAVASQECWLAVAGRVMEIMGLQDEDALSLVKQELGGAEISDQKHDEAPAGHSAVAPPGSGTGPRSAAHREMCSQRAAFPHPVMLDRRFRPSAYGYSGEDFQRDYPHANPRETLEKFFSHHIDKGDLHKNWLEKFWSYALMADRIAREQAANKTSTDSMGQPLDPAERARRVRVAREHERQQNEYIDQQIAAEREQP